MKFKIGSALLALAFSSTLSAQPYLGVGVGQGDYDVPTFDESTSFEIFGGYKFNKNFAIEGKYVDFGDSDDGIPPVWTLSGSSIGVYAKGILPVSEQFDLYGIAGFQSWEVDLDEDGFGNLVGDDGTDLGYGIGADLMIGEAFSVGVAYTIFDADEEEVTTLGVNGAYRF